MCGQVSYVLCSSAGIHAFFLKWDITKIPGRIPIQDYLPTVNIPPSNDSKFLLQISINEAVTVGYKFYLQKS